MIQRIQLYKLDAQAEGRSPEQAARALAAEVARAKGPLSATVGLPADPPSARSWDLSLVLTFEDGAAAAAFLGGDTLRDAVQRSLGAAIVVEKGWTFESIDR
jgi:hypothetical protein